VRRIFSVLAVAALVAAMMLVTGALPAFAIVETSSQANCVGEEAVIFNQREGFHGAGGQRTATEAQFFTGIEELASTNCAP
jgi:hypothetical protein